MRTAVVITDPPAGTPELTDVTEWLATNDVPAGTTDMIYNGMFLVECLKPGVEQQRHWRVRSPAPRGLLARLAALELLRCSAVHTGLSEYPLPCVRPVDPAGRHPGDHHPPDGMFIGPGDWSTLPLPSREQQERAMGIRHRAVVLVNDEQLAALLRLPPGQRVIGVEPRLLTLSLAVHLEGDGLPECVPGAEPPSLGADGRIASWKNPAWEPTLLRDLDPAAKHAAVLAALRAFGRLEAHATTEARARILQRHAPETRGDRVWCRHPIAGQPWPCPDYLDAATGLTHGLTVPTPQETP